MENVLLVFGGMSYEHDISIVTASQIYNKTRFEKVNLIPLYITKNNRFFVYKTDKFDISDFSNFDEKTAGKYFKEVVFISGEKEKLFSKSLFGLKEYLKVSIAIIACHGGMGENGKLVSFLESFGIYSSSGSFEGLAISMNKMLFKNIMRGVKIPVVSGFVVNQKTYQEYKDSINLRLRFMKFPVVLKPVNGGSSIGLFVAKTKEDFEKMILSAFEFDEEVLVEKFISGAREFNVAIMGDTEDFLVSEVDEPVKLSEILSFEDKYLSGSKSKNGGVEQNCSMSSQKRNFPANITDELREKMRNFAKNAFKSLKLSGVVRIDFLYDECRDKLYICEVNAVPGSLSYYFFSKGKVLINEFIEILIKEAKKKQDKGNNFKIDYVTKVL